MKTATRTIAKQTTQRRIITAARNEFLKLGFKDSSLRNIAKAAGVTTGAFYGYYPDKEALFSAAVGPATDNLRNIYLNSQIRFEALPTESKIKIVSSYSKEELAKFINCIYSDFDAFKLVICRSSGTVYENYIHSLVEIEVKYSEKFFNELDDTGLFHVKIKPNLMHILYSSFFHAIFETVEHDMSREEAEDYIEKLCNFFQAGWSKLWSL